jgi:hypothetical protein
MGKRSSKTKNKIKRLQQHLRWARKHPPKDLEIVVVALAVLSLRYPKLIEECDRVAAKLNQSVRYELAKDYHYEWNRW